MFLIFFPYAQQGFVFPLLRDFCNVHDCIATFSGFLLYKDFNIFQKLFFAVSLHFLDKIFMYMKQNHKNFYKKINRRFKNVTFKF